jgi:hypothetical protein
MHAEHADNSELNELSVGVIGGAFTLLNKLPRFFEKGL